MSMSENKILSVYNISVGKMFGKNGPGSNIVAGICCPPSDWAGNPVSRGLEPEI